VRPQEHWNNEIYTEIACRKEEELLLSMLGNKHQSIEEQGVTDSVIL